MSSDDARAVASALAGAIDGYRRLYERHCCAVARLIGAFYELDPEEELRLLAESFARAFAGLASLSEPGRFGPWLLGMARQACLTQRAMHRGRGPTEPPEGPVGLARDPGPADLKHELAFKALGALPEEERKVALLAFGEKPQTPRQISAQLCLGLEKVENALERARAAVKKRLAARLLEQRSGPAGEAGKPAHLDAALWQRLVDGERLQGEKELAAHLESGCAACEAFLVAQERADGLDGEADAALLGEARCRVRAGDTTFLRVMRRLKLDSRLAGRPGAPERIRRSKVIPLSLAGALGIAGLVALLWHDPPGERPGGEDPGALPEIAFAIAPQAEGEAPEDAAPGQACSEQQAVLIRYELVAPSFVLLLRLMPDGQIDLLSQPGRLGAGFHDLTVNDKPARVALHGAVGRNRFAVVASEVPLDRRRLSAVGAALRKRGADEEAALRLPEGVSLAWFDLDVVAALPGEAGQRDSEP
jgi:DNA-directed RNA polymerase specialized sigma24 family protein